MSQNEDRITKLPPQNLEAERALLGACLMDKNAANNVRGMLSTDDFYSESHKLIYSSITRLVDEAQPCDPVTVSDALKINGDLERIGGIAYVSSLLDSVPAPAAAPHYAKIIREKAQTRALIEAASNILANSYDGGFNAAELQEIAEKAIFDVGQGRRSENLFPLRDLMQGVYDVMSQIKASNGVTGVPTFPQLDKNYLAGLQKGDLVLLAARPGMGKTSMAINIAQNAAAKDHKIVAVFSLEMPKEQLVQRILCTEGKVNHESIRTGRASKQDLRKLLQAVQKLAKAELYINDTMSITAAEIRSQCRKLKMDRGLDLIVIDYIQLMQSAPGRKTENRQLEVAEISRSLKAMAKELDVPVLALSQLSRLAEQKNEKPNLSHLRESGALEQDADVVLMLNRVKHEDDDDMGESEMKRHKASEEIEVIIAKHRNGRTGEQPMNFIKEYTLFADFAQDWVGNSHQSDISIPPPPPAAEIPPEPPVTEQLPLLDDDPPF